MTAENVTFTRPETPVISNIPFSEARPVEVSKPAAAPEIEPVALLDPVNVGAEAVPAPVAEPPATGISVAPAELEPRELLYWPFAPAWAKAELCMPLKLTLPADESMETFPNELVLSTEMSPRANGPTASKRLNPITTEAKRHERVFIGFSNSLWRRNDESFQEKWAGAVRI